MNLERLSSDQLSRIAIASSGSGRGSSDFDLNPGVELPKNRQLRDAAVLVPFIEHRDSLSVILTKRSSALKHHPGQVAFPGGKVDPTDASPEAAALREAHEEIGLDPNIVDLLGVLPRHETVTGFSVVPVLARVRVEFDPVPERGEVDEVFSVPLHHVTDPSNYLVQARRWKGVDRRYFAVPYGPYYIWGATARILRGLAERLR